MEKNKILTSLLIIMACPFAVSASTDTDRKIEAAAKASYNYHVVLEDRVKVKALDGVVTLTGKVEDNHEKALAQSTVENLSGVKSVKNEITVKPTYEEHSDAWMAFKIRSLLLVKADVSVATTDVAVKDGIVTLTGTADSLAQKELTGIYAKEIDWVKSVKNNIVVKPETKLTVMETIDDASIASQIKYTLLSHRSTSKTTNKVTVNNGIVVVTGKADSDAEKSLVSKLIKDIRGVKSVENKMTVN